MTASTQTLREALANRWRFLWRGWAHRAVIHGLLDAASRQEREIAAARQDMAALQKRLDTAREEQNRKQEQINKLWRFIAARHRLDEPAEPGTIRHILEQMGQEQ